MCDPTDRPKARRAGRWLALVAALAAVPAAEGQDRADDFAGRPILVLDTGGHHAPVRRLAFTADESKLLSAGDDKVVRVWDLAAAPPGLGWTIRPPIWRGAAGAINALALGPPDAAGQQPLALAGFGIQSYRGEIGVYRFPGAVDRRLGDARGYIANAPGAAVDPARVHTQAVAALAYSPDGRRLASCGVDGTVRLWDAATRAPLERLAPPGQGEVYALAFTPDGRWLLAGGLDGTLRIWDVAAPAARLLRELPPPTARINEAAGWQINALAVSEDGRYAAIGREDGALLRYDLKAADIGASVASFATGQDRGPVEALAFGPGGLLASSIIAKRADPAGRPTVACDVLVWNVENLKTPAPYGRTTNLAYALAFSPKGTYLAYAGGDRQEVVLFDLKKPATAVLSGEAAQGRSVWDVGFAGDGVIAYSLEGPDAPPPAEYPGFDLRGRAAATYPADRVRRAIREYDGWTVRPVGPHTLDILKGGSGRRLELDRSKDGRWWSYSFLPPGPGHPRATLAVACQQGLVVFRLEDGERTRVLDGHSGATYCLAPSADGRWLATGSADQTVRLWSLAGCDTLPPLGAAFEPRGAGLVVQSVERGGFADVAGFRVGDVAETFALGKKQVPRDEFLRRFDALPPNEWVQVIGHRRPAPGAGQAPAPAPAPGPAPPDEPIVLGSTRRDRPALSLFIGADREWVLWTPRGYYDASVIGDRKYLGWQVNRYDLAVPRPVDYFPIVTHDRDLRQPRGMPDNVIDRLLAAGGVEAAMAGPPPPDPVAVVLAQPPADLVPYLGPGSVAVRDPEGRVVPPGAPLPPSFTMPPGPLVIDWRAISRLARAIGSFQAHRDGTDVPAVAVPAPPAAPADPAARVATFRTQSVLAAGGATTIQARTDRDLGNERRVELTPTVVGPPPAPGAHLRLLAIAPTFADPRIPPIAASARDAADLPPFFARHMVTGKAERFGAVDPIGVGLAGNEATAGRVLAAFQAAASAPVAEGDVAVVVIETHVLTREKSSRLVVSDSKGLPPAPDSTLPTEAISKALESMVRGGCKVIVVLDGVHDLPGAAERPDVVEWVRSLCNDYNVITVVATTRTPIRLENVAEHRPLAQAILDALRAPARRPDDTLMSLGDFRAAVTANVRKLTRQKGEPAVYIPGGINAGFPILDRKP